MGQAPPLYLYDVTSSYLEGDHNELGAYGYNRDGKKGKKQIVIGLLTDAQGWPITVEVFPGNTQDRQTFEHQIDQLVRRFGVERVTFVGHRGMIKVRKSATWRKLEFHYITAITKPQIEALLKTELFQLSMFDEELVEVITDPVRYLLRLIHSGQKRLPLPVKPSLSPWKNIWPLRMGIWPNIRGLR